jgi:hypothetical protein
MRMIISALRWAVVLLGCLSVVTLAHAGDTPGAWRLDLRPSAPAAVFDVDKDAVLSATVRHVTGTGRDGTLVYTVTDGDVVLGSGEASVSVAPGEATQIRLNLGCAAALPHEQSLTVTVKLIADRQEQAIVRKSFGFLPRKVTAARPAVSPFGLLAEGDWPLLQRLGVSSVRPNWSWNERPMEWAYRYGILDCPLINEANAFVRGDISEQEYYDFVYESVRRFKGYVTYWQLGNEFDIFHKQGPADYVGAQKIGYAAAKAADPHCVVVAGSITELQCRREGWAEALQAGLPQYCDVYDFHFYQDLRTTQSLLEYIHATCQQYSASKPLWVTETAQVGMFDPDEKNQADYVFKRYAHLMANRVSVVMWHCYRWPYAFEVDPTAATGLVDHDGFARPALFAFAAMSNAMDGVEFVRPWKSGDDMYAYEFAGRGKSLLITWSDGADGTLEVACPPGEVHALHSCGQRTVLPAVAQGPLRVTASKSPVIYQLPGKLESVTAGK